MLSNRGRTVVLALTSILLVFGIAFGIRSSRSSSPFAFAQTTTRATVSTIEGLKDAIAEQATEVYVSADMTSNVPLTINHDVAIDLGWHTISFTVSPGIQVTGGNVTIIRGKIVSSAGTAIQQSGGKLTIDGTEINGATCALEATGGETALLEGTLSTSSDGTVVSASGSSLVRMSAPTINDGGQNSKMLSDNGANFKISGGSFYSNVDQSFLCQGCTCEQSASGRWIVKGDLQQANVAFKENYSSSIIVTIDGNVVPEEHYRIDSSNSYDSDTGSSYTTVTVRAKPSADDVFLYDSTGEGKQETRKNATSHSSYSKSYASSSSSKTYAMSSSSRASSWTGRSSSRTTSTATSARTTVVYRTRTVSSPTSSSTSVSNTSGGKTWSRNAGKDRYQTMADVVGATFTESEWAVLACGKRFPDALTASSLAGAMECPIVTTAPGTLSQDAAQTLARLGVRHVLVAGGTSAVSDKVIEALTILGIDATRVAGTDRVATSLAVLRQVPVMGDASDTVIIATGSKFADSLSVGPWAYLMHAPIVLVDGSGKLSAEAVSAIKAGGFTEILIVGGTTAVSAEVENQLSGLSVTRLAGSDRYATSSAVASYAATHGLGFAHPVVTSGATFSDALVGAPFAARQGGVLLLVSEGSKMAETLLKANKLAFVSGTVLGGEKSVSSSLMDRLAVAVQ